VQPIALGGTSTIENVRLLCRSHNLLAARFALGDRCMDRYTSDPRKPPSDPPTCDGAGLKRGPRVSTPGLAA
jgi:hypothetical protein